MRTSTAVLSGLGVAAVLAASSLAVYYRGRAEHYRREWSAAVDQAGRRVAAVVAPLTAPAGARFATGREVRAAGDVPPAAPEVQPAAPEVQSAGPDTPALPAETAASGRGSDSGRFRRRDLDWIENLRTNDPQRYEEFQRRRQEMQQRASNAWDQTSDYFVNRDTTTMAEQEMAEYQRMVALLDETRLLSLQLQSGLPPDDRWQVMSSVRSNLVALSPLLNNERDREYRDLAVGMGLSAADAASFVDYVNQIASNTSVRTIFPGLGRGGMPRGIPPGGPPGPPPGE